MPDGIAELLNTIIRDDDGAHASELSQVIKRIADTNKPDGQEALRWSFQQEDFYKQCFQEFVNRL